jgi:hypothetical protein
MGAGVGSSIIATSFARVTSLYPGWIVPFDDLNVTEPGSVASSRVAPSLTSKLLKPDLLYISKLELLLYSLTSQVL